NVQSLLAARFLVAGACLVALVVLLRRPWPRRGIALQLVALGPAGYVLQSAAYFNSLRYVPAAITSILLYTYPAIVVLLSAPLYGATLTRNRVLARGLTLFGVLLVAQPRGGLRWEGVVLGLLSA